MNQSGIAVNDGRPPRIIARRHPAVGEVRHDGYRRVRLANALCPDLGRIATRSGQPRVGDRPDARAGVRLLRYALGRRRGRRRHPPSRDDPRLTVKPRSMPGDQPVRIWLRHEPPPPPDSRGSSVPAARSRSSCSSGPDSPPDLEAPARGRGRPSPRTFTAADGGASRLDHGDRSAFRSLSAAASLYPLPLSKAGPSSPGASRSQRRDGSHAVCVRPPCLLCTRGHPRAVDWAGRFTRSGRRASHHRPRSSSAGAIASGLTVTAASGVRLRLGAGVETSSRRARLNSRSIRTIPHYPDKRLKEKRPAIGEHQPGIQSSSTTWPRPCTRRRRRPRRHADSARSSSSSSPTSPERARRGELRVFIQSGDPRDGGDASP